MNFSQRKAFLFVHISLLFYTRKLIFTVNGNRYEGSFSNGMKHGEGTFYHCQTGQAQKGIWVNDVCKCSMMQDDEIRFRAAHPTPFPIPEVRRHKLIRCR